MNVWQREFEATFEREDGVVVVDDADIPLPEGFVSDPKERSTVVFPPHARAGDHYHEQCYEIFVGFGEGMELVLEERESKEVTVIRMDPRHHHGKCLVVGIPPGVPHAVINQADSKGFLIELASQPRDKVEYTVGT